MINWKNELGVIRPEFGAGVKAFFTERLGGVSSGPWGIMGLNVGSRVGDNSSCVRMNRSIVADLCPSEPRWMTQVHGIAVVNAEDVTDESVQADAQITTQPETVCVVQVILVKEHLVNGWDELLALFTPVGRVWLPA